MLGLTRSTTHAIIQRGSLWGQVSVNDISDVASHRSGGQWPATSPTSDDDFEKIEEGEFLIVMARPLHPLIVVLTSS